MKLKEALDCGNTEFLEKYLGKERYLELMDDNVDLDDWITTVVFAVVKDIEVHRNRRALHAALKMAFLHGYVWGRNEA